MSRLKNTVVLVKNGLWGDEPDGPDDGLPVVRVADFDRTRFVAREALTRRLVPASRRSGRILRRGDLLLEKSGGGEQQPVGVVVMYDRDEPAVCSNFVARLQLTPDTNARFMTYVHAALYAVGVNCRSIKQTTGIQNLDGRSYLDEIVPIPPSAEQRRVADYLDRKTAAIDALIEKKERLLELLEEKRQALITRAVTKGLNPDVPMKSSDVEWLGPVPASYKVVAVRRLLELQRGVDITKDEQNQSGNVPVVSSGGIASYHDTALIEGPGIVVGRKGTVGSVHWVESDYWPHDTTLYVKRYENCERRYAYYILRAIKLEHFDTGSANPTLNRNLIHPFKVVQPPLDEQARITSALDCEEREIEQMKAKLVRSAQLLREYRQALITAAVTGKLDVTTAA